jgi:hypothetical protein
MLFSELSNCLYPRDVIIIYNQTTKETHNISIMEDINNKLVTGRYAKIIKNSFVKSIEVRDNKLFIIVNEEW